MQYVVDKNANRNKKPVHNLTHRLWTGFLIKSMSTKENNLIIAKITRYRNGSMYLSTKPCI